METARFRDEQLLGRHILQLSKDRPRTFIGIAGIPGAGKSTLARHLRDALGHIAHRPDIATVVPLDGFHLRNAELTQRGLLERKGSPETFLAQTFFSRLIEIKRGGRPVLMPTYSRQLHEPVPDALEVRPDAAFVIVEGNYVLSEFGVWRSIAALFDVKVFVDTPADKAKQWVIDRHIAGGLTPEEAAAKYKRNDKPNSEIIAAAMQQADIIFEPS